jgi:hypothetical protein
LRYRLRTLLILLAIGPPILAGAWLLTNSVGLTVACALLLAALLLWYSHLLIERGEWSLAALPILKAGAGLSIACGCFASALVLWGQVGVTPQRYFVARKFVEGGDNYIVAEVSPGGSSHTSYYPRYFYNSAQIGDEFTIIGGCYILRRNGLVIGHCIESQIWVTVVYACIALSTAVVFVPMATLWMRQVVVIGAALCECAVIGVLILALFAPASL